MGLWEEAGEATVAQVRNEVGCLSFESVYNLLKCVLGHSRSTTMGDAGAREQRGNGNWRDDGWGVRGCGGSTNLRTNFTAKLIPLTGTRLDF